MNTAPRTVRDWESVAEALAPGTEVRVGHVLLWRDHSGLWWVQTFDPPGAVQFSRTAGAVARKAAWLQRHD